MKTFKKIIQRAPGIMLIVILVWALLASVPQGMPRWVTSAVVFVLFLVFLHLNAKEKNEKARADKYEMEREQDGYV